MKYNQDNHTATTIKRVKTLIAGGNLKKALETLELAVKRCESLNGKASAKALLSDVLFTIR